MLQELINLAEELYARGKDPYLAADANGAFMEEHAVKLGKMIEEVGKTLHYYHSKCQEQHDNRVWMQLKIKKLEEEILAIRTIQ